MNRDAVTCQNLQWTVTPEAQRLAEFVYRGAALNCTSIGIAILEFSNESAACSEFCWVPALGEDCGDHSPCHCLQAEIDASIWLVPVRDSHIGVCGIPVSRYLSHELHVPVCSLRALKFGL